MGYRLDGDWLTVGIDVPGLTLAVILGLKHCI